MSADLGHVASRELVAELMRRAPGFMRRRLRGLRRGQARPRSAGDRETFATLVRPDRPPVPLWSGYRAAIKPRWMTFYWPVDVLLRLNRRVQLPASLQALASEIASARTLPRPLAEIAEGVAAVAGRHREHVARSDWLDPMVGAPVLGMIPSRAEVRAIATYHVDRARRMLATMARAGLRVDAARVLEIGCGTGYTTFALGVAEAVGVDLASSVPGGAAEREGVAAYFSAQGDGPRRARLEQADAHALPFGDETFELVHNASVLEHVRDPGTVFREAHRVLTPGGFALFDVDPWFGPQGGHSLCTLDFPWGHVRLGLEEFEAYVARYRPHEVHHTLDFYRNGFQTPRRTVAEIEALALEAGFAVVDWQETRMPHRDHYALVSAGVLAECRGRHPAVTLRDLMTSSYTMLLCKR